MPPYEVRGKLLKSGMTAYSLYRQTLLSTNRCRDLGHAQAFQTLL